MDSIETVQIKWKLLTIGLLVLENKSSKITNLAIRVTQILLVNIDLTECQEQIEEMEQMQKPRRRERIQIR